MLKRFSMFFLGLFMVLFIASCTNNKTPESDIIPTYASGTETGNSQVQEPQESHSDIPDWFELCSISIAPDETDGITKAETETSSYEFYGRTEEENMKLAQINEIAALVLKNEYGYSPPKSRIIHFIDEKGIWVSELSLEVQQIVASNGRTVINPDFVWSVGALFYGSSRNLLPAWLATGLELYWSDKFEIERIAFDKEFDINAWQVEMVDLPAFGDFWFEKNDDETRLSIAFSFVKWLDENRLLKELVTVYLDNKQAEGDLLFADAWQKFTGHDIRTDFCFEKHVRYLYGYYSQTYDFYLKTNNFESYTCSFLTQHGHYLFDRMPGYSEVVEIVNTIDAQYVYAKQWLGFEDAAPIPTRMLLGRINGTVAVGTEYVAIPSNDIVGAIHEAIHYLLFTKNIHADFISLSEGLPMALMYIYASQEPKFYGALIGENFAGDGTFDFKQHAHIRAANDVNHLIENDRYGTDIRAYGVRAEDRLSDFPQGLLNTYETAASFVLFMLEMGSKEDFMRLYTDISVAEELYGKDFNALYEQWLEFLKKI